jgi:uncharacterized protein
MAGIMKIYRRVIPKIAKDIIRSLLAARSIEVEDGHRDEAELDVAAVLVEYLNELDKLKNDAQDAIERHKLPAEMLGRVKKTMAETRKVVLGDGALEHVLDKILEALFTSKHIEEVFAEDNELRKVVQIAVQKYLGVDEELDREVRGRLKNLREGTSEWEVEYGRLIEQMRSTKGAMG